MEFRLDAGSGVATYRQLADQVRQALRLGILNPGDQLPTVREVVASIAINPIPSSRPTKSSNSRVLRRVVLAKVRSFFDRCHRHLARRSSGCANGWRLGSPKLGGPDSTRTLSEH